MSRCNAEANRLAKIRMMLARRAHNEGVEVKKDNSFYHKYEAAEFDNDALAIEYRAALQAYKKCMGKKGEDNDDDISPQRVNKQQSLEG